MSESNISDLVYVKVYPDAIIFSPRSIFAPIPTERYVACGYENIKDFFFNESHTQATVFVEANKKNPVNGLLLDQKEWSMEKYHHTYNILMFYKVLVSKKNSGCIPLWFPSEDVFFDPKDFPDLVG